MAASVAACVNRLLVAGVINRAQAQTLLNQQQAAVQAGVPNPAQTVITNARQALTRQKYLAALQAQVIGGLLQRADAHPTSYARGVMAILARDVTGKAKGTNVDQRRVAVLRQFTGPIAEALSRMRLTRLGLHQDRALVDDVVRELFGRSTGNADAARFAKSMADVFEAARVRFNAAGGDIPKRADWGMPQSHDARRVAKAGLAEWKAFILPRLDPQKMVNAQGLPMTPAELSQAVDEAFQTISTNGLNKITPGQVGGTKLANRHQDHRFFVFKDADAWLEYDRRFGGGNPFFTMMNHLENMAGDIALLEVMGPNPTQAYRVLRDTARQKGVEGNDLMGIDARWSVVSGVNDQATLPLAVVEGLQGLRNVLTAARLGSAVLSAASDLAFMRQATAWNGLNSTRAMKTFLSLLNPANEADRLAATRAMLTADAWMTLGVHGNRYGDVSGTGVAARMAEVTMRASGLNAWTDAAQKAIGMEWLMGMADSRLLQWADLPAEKRAMLEVVGMEEAGWDVLRHAPLQQGSSGVVMFDLPGLLNRGTPEAQQAVNQALEAIETLTHMAIPSPDANARAISARFGQKGTLTREVANAVLQFKSFPIAVVLSHVYKGMHMGAAGGGGTYLASLAIATTVMGALSLQLKEIAKGRQPMDMDSPKFWAQAFAQGGGAGIFGDFIQSGVFGSNRFGQGIVSTALGPTAGLVEDVTKLTAGQFGEVIEGKDPKVGADLVQAASQYTPVLGSLWYTRLAFERWVLNQLQMEVDPDARSRWRQEARRKEKETGARYWWKKGETLPESAPIEF